MGVILRLCYQVGDDVFRSFSFRLHRVGLVEVFMDAVDRVRDVITKAAMEG